MGLNIKNERVHDLVREAARRSGLSQTAVVEEAVRHYLAQSEDAAREDDERRRRAELDDIVADLQRLVAGHGGLGMEPEDLYDSATGLPA